MSSFAKLSNEQKAVIIVLRKKKTKHAIAEIVRCSASTVSDLIKNTTKRSYKREQGNSKVSLTSTRNDRLLERMCLRNKQGTSSEICTLHLRTRRRLISACLNARRLRKMPMLTKKMKGARKHSSCTEKQWH